MNEIVQNFVEVKLPDEQNFLKVKETLTRIGVASRKENKLYQSCHILHKKGKYYIVHFKELFLLDGRSSSLSEEDKKRRNTIANLLEQWELIEVCDRSIIENDLFPLSKIKILPYNEKDQWELIPKYSIGKK